MEHESMDYKTRGHTSKFKKCIWFSLQERQDYKELLHGSSKALQEKINEGGYEETRKKRCDILQNSRAFTACERKETRKCLNILGRECPKEAKKICEKSPLVHFFAS
ncbi:hypothetical protein PMV_406 [Port-miou virus]|uniref:Uncharacterized protein n=1 Tax=Port-miou virus TaxID=1733873 RepID=A0A0N7G2H0_9VIRU|nr:hypothetical protein PMV_406 [Port-miou virus]